MKTFYTGTTLENLQSILRDECIRTNPPSRVWNEYSAEFVYLIPADEDKEEGEPFEFCLEQSSFAVAALNGSKRVILEISGIDESKLVEDKDGPDGSVAFPKDIPLSNIVQVYVEKTNRSEKVKELIAITHFVQRQEKITCRDLEDLYHTEYNEEAVYEAIPILNIHSIPLKYLIDEEELSSRYMDLIEEVDRGIPMETHDLPSVHKLYSSV